MFPFIAIQNHLACGLASADEGFGTGTVAATAPIPVTLRPVQRPIWPSCVETTSGGPQGDGVGVGSEAKISLQTGDFMGFHGGLMRFKQHIYGDINGIPSGNQTWLEQSSNQVIPW